jgi:hypothetical protein
MRHHHSYGVVVVRRAGVKMGQIVVNMNWHVR